MRDETTVADRVSGVAWWHEGNADPHGAGRPDLSIVVPCFGRAASVRRAVQSILREALPGIEIVLVDDGSEPALDLPAEWGEAVRVVRHPRNLGAAAARNSGMALARGRFLAFLDSDDHLLPGTLAARLDAARRLTGNRPLAISACGFEEVDPEGRVIGRRFPKPSRRPADFAAGCWFNPGSCVIVRHPEFVRAVGLQDETLPRLEDFDWFLRAGRLGACLEPDGILGARLERGPTRAAPAIRQARERLEAKWGGALTAGTSRRMRAYLALELCAAAVRERRPLQALRALMRSLVLWPRLSLHLSPGWRRVSAG